jgi:hypothetical protein
LEERRERRKECGGGSDVKVISMEKSLFIKTFDPLPLKVKW